MGRTSKGKVLGEFVGIAERKQLIGWTAYCRKCDLSVLCLFLLQVSCGVSKKLRPMSAGRSAEFKILYRAISVGSVYFNVCL